MEEFQTYKNQQIGDPIFLLHKHPLSLPGMWGASTGKTDPGEEEISGEQVPHHRGRAGQDSAPLSALVIRKMSIWY